MTSLSDDRRILALFADPKELYTRAEFMDLTRTPGAELDAMIDRREVHPDSYEPDRFAWHDAAFVAVYERWGARRIVSALLRHGRADVVPPLNRLTRVNVQLPVYQLRALQASAAERSRNTGTRWTVSDALVAALSAWVSSHERLAPDIVAAEHWPGVEWADSRRHE